MSGGGLGETSGRLLTEREVDPMSYPKWIYHATKEAVIVATPEAHEALGAEWAESPAAFTSPPGLSLAPASGGPDGEAAPAPAAPAGDVPKAPRKRAGGSR